MHDLRVLKHFLCASLALLLLAGCEYFNLPLDKFTETHTAVISVESVTFDTATVGRFLSDSGTYVLEPPSPLDNVTVYINLKNDVNLAFDYALTGTVNGVDTPGRITAVETGERRLGVNIANPGNGERYDIRLAIRAETGRSFNISVPPILCSIITCTVTFDTQGHGASPSPQTLPPLALVSDPGALSENGWIFGGWYKEADCTNPWNFDSDTVSGNITLYAKWTPNIKTYTVTFDTQGHGASPSPQTLPPLGLVSDPGALSETGWNFGGWYKEADCVNVWNFAGDTISGNTTLYAKWTPGVGITVINALGAVTDIAAPVHDAPAMTPYMPAGVGYSADNFEWTSGLSGGTSGGYVYGTPAVATVTLAADTGCTFTGTAIDAAAIQTVFSSGSPAAAIQGTPGATLVFTLTYTVAQVTLSGTVSIAGTAQWNQALTANIAGINPSASASDYTYQWKRGGVDISGANSQTYTLTAADEAKIISVEVSRTGYASSITGTIGAPVNSIGGTGQAGGIIFYVDTNATVYPGKTYLEAARADISGTLKWASPAFMPSSVGGTGAWTSIPGTQIDIGTGAANTAAILGKDANAPAAKACVAYRAPTPYNTFDDWFLPSKNELNAMWTSGITATSGNGFHTSGNYYYWSSSEGSITTAWEQHFSAAIQGYGAKDEAYCVRAVRAF